MAIWMIIVRCWLNAPGRHEKSAITLPPEIDIAPVPAGRTLSEMLAAGELEPVVLSLMRDLGLVNHNEPVKRLFTQGLVLKGGTAMSKA